MRLFFWSLHSLYSTMRFAKSSLLCTTVKEIWSCKCNTVFPIRTKLHTHFSIWWRQGFFIPFTLSAPSSTYLCLGSNSKHITWQRPHSRTYSTAACVCPELSSVYPCLCFFRLFSVQASECQAVWWWRASLGCAALLRSLPAPLLALPVVTLGCLPTWQL